MELIKAIFGSRLYGTNIETSDTDYKYLFLPNGKDIILQRAAQNIQANTGNDNSKNGALDTDCEGFSLKYFLHLLSQGQTFAVEFMFIPKTAIVGEIHPCISELFENRDKLISKKIEPFIGYTRRQASTYCIKSERMDAAKICSEFFSDKHTHVRIEEHLEEFKELIKLNPFIEVVSSNSGKFKTMDMISCCGRKLPITAVCKRAYDLYEELYQSYGSRAKQASSNSNLDYKALYHAVRIAYETKQLLEEGLLTFPRPEAKMLLQIRHGELAYEKISEILEKVTADVETLLQTTGLRASADIDWINDFVEKWYYFAIEGYKNGKQ